MGCATVNMQQDYSQLLTAAQPLVPFRYYPEILTVTPMYAAVRAWVNLVVL
jgi:hypothetical protein